MEDLDKWGIEPNLNVGPFSAEQAKYLSWHRHEYAFKPEFE
jgi:hypothetical protein